LQLVKVIAKLAAKLDVVVALARCRDKDKDYYIFDEEAGHRMTEIWDLAEEDGVA
jgi:tryptophanase